MTTIGAISLLMRVQGPDWDRMGPGGPALQYWDCEDLTLYLIKVRLNFFTR